MNKRVNKSLSHHRHGRKAKAVKGDATRNVFPLLKEESTSLHQVPLTHGSIKTIPIAQKIKSICNKKDYEWRKTRRTQQAVEHLEDELLSVHANIADLSHINKCISLEVSHLKASSEKSSLLLASRTDRFVAYQARKEEEIKTLKVRAEKKIAALEKQHKFVLVREKAERYRMERSHMKEVVSYTREIDSIQKAKE